MRRAALIYNPASGQDSPRRKAVIEGALSVLRRAGVEANALETNAPGSAGKLALEAVCNGCDTIIACGGDALFTKSCSAWWERRWRLGLCRWARRTPWLRTSDWELPR